MILIEDFVDVVDDDAKGLLLVPVRCCVVCMSRLPLPLLLSDRVPVVVAAAVVFLLHLEGGRHGDKDVDRGRIDILVDVDNGLLRSETNKYNELDCSCNRSNRCS